MEKLEGLLDDNATEVR